MSEKVKTDDNLSFKERVEEFESIRRLVEEFGEVAYRAARRYYLAAGYEVGYDTILEMVEEGALTRRIVRDDPVAAVLSILVRFFARRGGNMPELTAEGDTIRLVTRGETWCPAPSASERVGLAHCDICFAHKRAFAEGVATALCELEPGLQIQCYNLESRSLPDETDCIEAFKVIPAW